MKYFATERDHVESISDLVKRHRNGFTLEREFYTSPTVFNCDIERIYMKHWIYVGHASRIPNEGDYFLYSIAEESIIIIKGREGLVHALINVCRHRGSRLCLDEIGHVRNFVCPYHAWVYGIDGELLAARRMPNDFDRSVFGLRQCAVRVSEGLIFICVSEAPPEFDSVLSDVESFLRPHRLASTKICFSTRYEIKANWKLVAENFWECYHCSHVHPEFCSVMTYPESIQTDEGQLKQDAFVAEWEEYTRRQGHKTGSIKPVGSAIHRCQRVPIRPGFVTQSQDGKPVAPLLGDFTEYDGGVTGIQIYPILWFSISNDHAMLVRFTPLAPQVTETEYTWLVHEDAVEGVDYDVNRVTWLWRTTGAQDCEVCENNQAGVNSRLYVPGRFSRAEVDVDRFTQWYLEQLNSHIGSHRL